MGVDYYIYTNITFIFKDGTNYTFTKAKEGNYLYVHVDDSDDEKEYDEKTEKFYNELQVKLDNKRKEYTDIKTFEHFLKFTSKKIDINNIEKVIKTYTYELR